MILDYRPSPASVWKGHERDTLQRRVVRALSVANGVVELADYCCTAPTEIEFPAHKSMIELALNPRPGAASAIFAAPGLERRPIGDLMFIPAGHTVRVRLDEGRWQAIMLRFNRVANDRRGWSVAELHAGLDVRCGKVHDDLLKAAMELNEPAYGTSQLRNALCLQIGVALGRYFRQIQCGLPLSSRTLHAAQIKAVNDCLDREGPAPEVEELAKLCGFSVRHFTRMFRSTTGQPVTEYATQRRINRAQQLLAVPNLPVKQIAWACGFSTAAAFSATFRRMTGVQPTSYRRSFTH